MTEEVKIQDPEPSQIDVVAKKMGWDPEYKGENAKTAEEFILYSREIMDGMSKRVRNQSKQIGDLNYAMGELKSHNEAVYQAEVSRLKRELKELKEKRKEAVTDGDNERVAFLDEQIKEINSVPAPKKPDTPPPLPDGFEEWNETNQWFGTDTELTQTADNMFEELKRDDPVFRALPYKRKLKKIESLIKNEFPEKFESEKKPTPPAGGVESGGKKAAKSKVYTLADLPDDLKKTAKIFERQGVMSVKDYIADLQKTGVLA